MADELEQTISLGDSKPPSSLERRQPCLKILAGETAGHVVPVQASPMILGRAKTNALVVDVTGVSREHAQFLRSGDLVSLSDNKSTNGTYVNGRRLSHSHTLEDGDLIGLEKTPLAQLLYLSAPELELSRRLYEQNAGDPATGAYNKRHLLERLEQEIALCKRLGLTLSLILFSPDKFETIAKDPVMSQSLLRALTERLYPVVATEDTLARLEGGIFGLLLRGKELDSAYKVALQLRSALENRPFPANAHRPRPVTLDLHVGIAEWAGEPTGQELLDKAQGEMLAARANGSGLSKRK